MKSEKDLLEQADTFKKKADEYREKGDVEGSLINYLLSANNYYNVGNKEAELQECMKYIIPLQRKLQEYKLLRNRNEKNDEVDCEDLSLEDKGKLTFATVSGQKRAKEQLKMGLLYPLLYPRLFPYLSKGVLFYGPPGTGKTLLAKAFANTLQQEAKEIFSREKDGESDIRILFYAPTGGNLKGKYVGETEKNIEKYFRCASKKASECEEVLINERVSEKDKDQYYTEINGVKKYKSKSLNFKIISVIFLDEVEAIAGDRDKDSSGLMTNSVNTLLQMMDGVNSFDNVVVMAATNKPWDLDPAILRRFDTKIYVSPPDNIDSTNLIKTEIYNYLIKSTGDLLEKKNKKQQNDVMIKTHNRKSDGSSSQEEPKCNLDDPKIKVDESLFDEKEQKSDAEYFDQHRDKYFKAFTDGDIKTFIDTGLFGNEKNVYSGGDIKNICRYVFKSMGTAAINPNESNKFTKMPIQFKEKNINKEFLLFQGSNILRKDGFVAGSVANDDGERAIYLQSDKSNSAFYIDPTVSLSEHNKYVETNPVHKDVDEVLNKTYPIKSNINTALIGIETMPKDQEGIVGQQTTGGTQEPATNYEKYIDFFDLKTTLTVQSNVADRKYYVKYIIREIGCLINKLIDKKIIFELELNDVIRELYDIMNGNITEDHNLTTALDLFQTTFLKHKHGICKGVYINFPEMIEYLSVTYFLLFLLKNLESEERKLKIKNIINGNFLNQNVQILFKFNFEEDFKELLKLYSRKTPTNSFQYFDTRYYIRVCVDVKKKIINYIIPEKGILDTIRKLNLTKSINIYGQDEIQEYVKSDYNNFIDIATIIQMQDKADNKTKSLYNIFENYGKEIISFKQLKESKEIVEGSNQYEDINDDKDMNNNRKNKYEIYRFSIEKGFWNKLLLSYIYSSNSAALSEGSLINLKPNNSNNIYTKNFHNAFIRRYIKNCEKKSEKNKEKCVNKIDDVTKKLYKHTETSDDVLSIAKIIKGKSNNGYMIIVGDKGKASNKKGGNNKKEDSRKIRKKQKKGIRKNSYTMKVKKGGNEKRYHSQFLETCKQFDAKLVNDGPVSDPAQFENAIVVKKKNIKGGDKDEESNRLKKINFGFNVYLFQDSINKENPDYIKPSATKEQIDEFEHYQLTNEAPKKKKTS